MQGICVGDGTITDRPAVECQPHRAELSALDVEHKASESAPGADRREGDQCQGKKQSTRHRRTRSLISSVIAEESNTHSRHNKSACMPRRLDTRHL